MAIGNMIWAMLLWHAFVNAKNYSCVITYKNGSIHNYPCTFDDPILSFEDRIDFINVNTFRMEELKLSEYIIAEQLFNITAAIPLTFPTVSVPTVSVPTVNETLGCIDEICSFQSWDTGRLILFIALGVITVLLIFLIICAVCSFESIIPCAMAILILGALSIIIFFVICVRAKTCLSWLNVGYGTSWLDNLTNGTIF